MIQPNTPKRYTTFGMATDQGKTGSLNGAAIHGRRSGRDHRRCRRHHSPPAIHASEFWRMGRTRGGRENSNPFAKRRCTNGTRTTAPCLSKRVFGIGRNIIRRRASATWKESSDREVLATRNSVGIADVSTLGKIDVQGPDAGAFLNKLYINGWTKLAVGKARYGLMLREDGMVMDDGTTSRLSEDHYLMTTTTANAGPVMAHMDYCHQILWPELDVQFVSVTEQWAQMAVAGPNARKTLQNVVDDFDNVDRRLSVHGRSRADDTRRHSRAPVPDQLLRRAGL